MNPVGCLSSQHFGIFCVRVLSVLFFLPLLLFANVISLSPLTFALLLPPHALTLSLSRLPKQAFIFVFCFQSYAKVYTHEDNNADTVDGEKEKKRSPTFCLQAKKGLFLCRHYSFVMGITVKTPPQIHTRTRSKRRMHSGKWKYDPVREGRAVLFSFTKLPNCSDSF
jgi:hypothetical protein